MYSVMLVMSAFTAVLRLKAAKGTDVYLFTCRWILIMCIFCKFILCHNTLQLGVVWKFECVKLNCFAVHCVLFAISFSISRQWIFLFVVRRMCLVMETSYWFKDTNQSFCLTQVQGFLPLKFAKDHNLTPNI